MLDLNSSKQLFFDTPKYTLSEVIKTQLKIRPIIEDLGTRKVPYLITKIFKNIKNLLETSFLDSDKIKASFFNLDHEIFEEKWNSDMEREITKFKKRYNDLGYLKFSEIPDIRITVQILFDFLEGLKEPAISDSTLTFLNGLITNNQSNGSKSEASLKNLRISVPRKQRFKVSECLIQVEPECNGGAFVNGFEELHHPYSLQIVS